MDPDPDEIEPIEDGEVVSPHGMDPQTVLRFVKTVGGWPGQGGRVACEPAVVEEMGLGLSPEVEAAVEPRGRSWCVETVERAAGRRRLRPESEPCDARALDLAARSSTPRFATRAGGG